MKNKRVPQWVLARMMLHAHNCKYEGAGGFVYSFRLVQEHRPYYGGSESAIKQIPQIKCCGCGYSLDI